MTPGREGRGAGPALDAEVSTLVMEKCPHAELRECSAEFSGEMDWWYECIACKETHSDHYWFEPTQYSTSIHNAFLVVEAMRAKAPTILLELTSKMEWTGKVEHFYYCCEFRECGEPVANGLRRSRLRTARHLSRSPQSSRRPHS